MVRLWRCVRRSCNSEKDFGATQPDYYTACQYLYATSADVLRVTSPNYPLTFFPRHRSPRLTFTHHLLLILQLTIRASPNPVDNDEAFVHNLQDDSNAAVSSLILGKHYQDTSFGVDVGRGADYLDADDGLSQGLVFSHLSPFILQPPPNLEAQIARFKNYPAQQVDIVQMQQDYLHGRGGTAAKRLLEKTQITGWDGITVDPLSEAVGYENDGSYIDASLLFGNRAGLDVARLPPEVSFTQNYQFQFAAGLWWWRMRFDCSPLGFNIDRRALYIGRLNHEDIWIIVTPSDHIPGRSPTAAEPYSAPKNRDPKPMTMKQYYVVMGFIAWCLAQDNVGAIYSEEYPRIDSHDNFCADTNIL